MKAIMLAACGLALASCAGVQGIKGNDTGGIIPWSLETELHRHEIAQRGCDTWGKYAVITSVTRGYGNYIAYSCRFDPPRRYFRSRTTVLHSRG